MTNINFQWVCDAVNLGGNVCQHPRKVIKADWQSGSPDKNGKFFAPYTTTGAQAFTDAAWATSTPSLAPGAEYASLQIMAMLRKNKALSGEHRMDVLVEGSPAQGSVAFFQMYFGAAAGEIAKHSIYQDFSKESSNP